VEPLVEYRSNAEDSTRWHRFSFRPGDIVIAAPSKSGTTWTQMLVGLLLFEGRRWPGTISKLSPWLDMTIRSEQLVFDILAAQTHRRFIKTHTPIDGVPIRDDVSYICVGRDPRDAVISMTHHLNNLDHERAAEVTARLGGSLETRTPPPGGFPPDFFLRSWVDRDADEPWPLESLLHHHRVAWARRHLPNVQLFHFADYTRDLTGEIERLARFVGIQADSERVRRIAAGASIHAARERAATVAPDAHLGAWKDPRAFFRSGLRGQWSTLLSDTDIEVYESRIAESVDEDLARWVHHGRGS